MKDKITKIKNYTSTAKNTPYQAANKKQVTTKISLTTLKIFWYLTKWFLFIFFGLMILLLFMLISSILSSTKDIGKSTYQPPIYRYIRVPRY